jgi:hypothetical protein
MIPRWQMVGIFALLAVVIGLAISASPHSYAYAFLTGRCLQEPGPPECHPRGVGFASGGLRRF